jgi:hypothetical protein
VAGMYIEEEMILLVDKRVESILVDSRMEDILHVDGNEEEGLAE